MSATRPASKTELKEYALRRLGFPTIDINVATEQLDDLVEEAIDYYQEYHYNGSYQAFLRIEVTEAIKTNAKTFGQSGSSAWFEQNNYVDHRKRTKHQNFYPFFWRGALWCRSFKILL